MAAGAVSRVREPRRGGWPHSGAFPALETASGPINIVNSGFRIDSSRLSRPCCTLLAAAATTVLPGALFPLQWEPLYNRQVTKALLKERFAFLCNSELLSDVRALRAGQGPQHITVHRFPAAPSSMPCSTVAWPPSAEIELPDVEPAAFLALLRFLYSGEVQIGPETVMTMLYTAKKYAVPALEAHCVEFSPSILGQIIHLCYLLRLDCLMNRSLLKVLGEALSLIWFPLMTTEEFAAGPAQSRILSDREVAHLFLHFTVNPK
ncbi:hypothetical protein MC885_013837 [Smutsia gigantea]|nr:hypothetical protein MC885_013837 [Smutsia gigantea]